MTRFSRRSFIGFLAAAVAQPQVCVSGDEEIDRILDDIVTQFIKERRLAVAEVLREGVQPYLNNKKSLAQFSEEQINTLKEYLPDLANHIEKEYKKDIELFEKQKAISSILPVGYSRYDPKLKNFTSPQIF